jgi:hypothetical protein
MKTNTFGEKTLKEEILFVEDKDIIYEATVELND